MFLMDLMSDVCCMVRRTEVICWYELLFFKQKTAYEMRISDWSSDVCSSDLIRDAEMPASNQDDAPDDDARRATSADATMRLRADPPRVTRLSRKVLVSLGTAVSVGIGGALVYRSEEHTSELQSLMRISYAVFCLKKKTQ